MIQLSNIEERDSVLYSGPHLFYGKPMIVKQWTSNFDFHQEILKVVPVWVKFPNLPLNCWSDNSLSRIGSVLGVPIYADECTIKMLRVSFARILVEINVTKPIVNEIMVEDPSGKKFAQRVIYNWLPAFCNKCPKIGHNCEVKRKIQSKPVQKWVPKITTQSIQGNVSNLVEFVPQADVQVANQTSVDGAPTIELHIYKHCW